MAKLLKHFKITVGLPGKPVTYFHNHDRAEAMEFINTFINNEIWIDIEFVTSNDTGYQKSLK